MKLEMKPILDRLQELWKQAEEELKSLLVPVEVQLKTDQGVLVWNKRRIGLMAAGSNDIKFIGDCTTLQRIAMAKYYPELKEAVLAQRKILMQQAADAVVALQNGIGEGEK